jgi:serine/threonine protein kinase
VENRTPGSENNWLRDFMAGAVGDEKPGEPSGSEALLLPAWMALAAGSAPDQLIGTYRIMERLGQGGMGVVLKASDSVLRRVVAIKFLSPRLAASAVARLRFTREAQAAAAINHPNVVTIHAVGEYDGLPYLVMEYVAGITLADRLKREGFLELRSILRIGIQIARGLAAAHAQGLIHRDIKPANILLENGIDRVKISDFGLACITDELWRLTASGVMLGTPPYMSPEQTSGGGLDNRSDLFSLGSVLYELCTGEPPFRGPTVKAILTQVRDSEPRPIRDLNSDIPPWLEHFIQRLMAKDPADRFPSTDDVVQALGIHLASIQGRTSDSSSADPDLDLPGPDVLKAGDGARKVDLFGTRDELASSQTGATTNPARDIRLVWLSSKLLVPRVIMAGTVFAMSVIAGAVWQQWSRPDLANSAITLLLLLAGLSILLTSVAQLVSAARSQTRANSDKGATAARFWKSLTAAALVLAAILAFLEFSAYVRVSSALVAIETRLRDGPPPTRREVEALIKRTADGDPPHSYPLVRRTITLNYSWNGVFRTYSLTADYAFARRARERDPQAILERAHWAGSRSLIGASL